MGSQGISQLFLLFSRYCVHVIFCLGQVRKTCENVGKVRHISFIPYKGHILYVISLFENYAFPYAFK